MIRTEQREDGTHLVVDICARTDAVVAMLNALLDEVERIQAWEMANGVTPLTVVNAAGTSSGSSVSLPSRVYARRV